MNNLFYTVLNMSITSSIIIALVIIIRLFFKNLPKKIQLYSLERGRLQALRAILV